MVHCLKKFNKVLKNNYIKLRTVQGRLFKIVDFELNTTNRPIYKLIKKNL